MGSHVVIMNLGAPLYDLGLVFLRGGFIAIVNLPIAFESASSFQRNLHAFFSRLSKAIWLVKPK